MLELPFDIMSHILKFLPVRDLLRFRCLSKSYCSLIDSRDFINYHLSQSNNLNTNRSLIIAQSFYKHKNLKSSTKIYSMNLDSAYPHLVEYDQPLSVYSESLPHNTIPDYDYKDQLQNNFSIVGSCNGLIAFYHPEHGMLLWNPSTKKQQNLPDFWGLHEVIGSVYLLIHGFGYDPVSDDYKVIRVWKIISGRRKELRVMVYSVKHNSRRTIEEDFPYDVMSRCSTLVGSYLHWIVTKPDDCRWIVAFNMEDEKFHKVPSPDLKYEDYGLMELAAVGGCLSMCMDARRDSLLEIWVMKEYGMRDSWIRIVSVDKANFSRYTPSRVKLIGCSKTGDKLLFDVEGYELWEYDLQKEEEKEETSQHSQNHIYRWKQCSPYKHVRGTEKWKQRLSNKRVRRIEMLKGKLIIWEYSFICVRSLVPVNLHVD
ncbi:F-box protein CPR1-like [Mercurialis annua]|uniref:F-box protein CPR1-like n=1 Tax=Mercurialis annua TaxID=3986 RepID=UPI00215E4368|nr:F-box protein CPR1-like [Mercurialis annua]